MTFHRSLMLAALIAAPALASAQEHPAAAVDTIPVAAEKKASSSG